MRPCVHDMLVALTLYRNRVRGWLQGVVTGGHTMDRDRVTAATADATDGDRGAATAEPSQASIAAAPPAVRTSSPSRNQPDERPQPQTQPPLSPRMRQQDAAVAVGTPPTSPSPYTDEEYVCAATVLSSMPEDMPLPPLAYTRRRSSSKTHTRLYRIRLPPKPRRAKR